MKKSTSDKLHELYKERDAARSKQKDLEAEVVEKEIEIESAQLRIHDAEENLISSEASRVEAE